MSFSCFNQGKEKIKHNEDWDFKVYTEDVTLLDEEYFPFVAGNSVVCLTPGKSNLFLFIYVAIFDANIAMSLYLKHLILTLLRVYLIVKRIQAIPMDFF